MEDLSYFDSTINEILDEFVNILHSLITLGFELPKICALLCWFSYRLLSHKSMLSTEVPKEDNLDSASSLLSSVSDSLVDSELESLDHQVSETQAKVVPPSVSLLSVTASPQAADISRKPTNEASSHLYATVRLKDTPPDDPTAVDTVAETRVFVRSLLRRGFVAGQREP